ncbi:hypothetical protein F6W69_11625 [Microbacterium oxydans]|uniref:hypothetical protein n=1 Tax=Microbacterium oxydans TaxID=82380 RepID=UPI001142DA92|nr:hypothetical protein [Microbacterium oxydans]KAB1891223.1 hypothetical protein F6W69_11625 [Microbacterium oxydans]GED38896.1 hypothetical protein MOX01_20380 [Microbacterium oxydans]
MTTTTKPDTRPLPLGIRHLPDAEHIACKDCGTPCGPDAPRTTFTVTGRMDPRGRLIEGLSEVTFGQCPACADLDAHAARTLDTHPSIRRMIGSPSIGQHRIASAFRALAAIGATPAATYSADGLLSLLNRLSSRGAAASWHRRFAPVREEDARRGTAAVEPWLHVSPDLLADIRHEYGDHLADRMPPRPVACPTGGCAWCGLGTVLAKRTAKPWTPHDLSPVSLGGVGRPMQAHLCPTCERAREFGDSMSSAVLDLIDGDRAMRRRVPHEPDLDGVHGWAVSGHEHPNTEPWAHLDLDGLRMLLARADY